MNIRLSNIFFLSAGFFLASVAGTLSHEFGHYIVAKWYGCDPRISYAFTYYDCEGSDANYAWMTFGGPFISMFLGSVGIILLLMSGKNAEKKSYTWRNWCLVFLSLFWLRPVINAATLLLLIFLNGKISDTMDEIVIAKSLGWAWWSVLLVFALPGAAASLFVFFKKIPKDQRSNFILAGIIGGIGGSLLWMKSLGPLLLP